MSDRLLSGLVHDLRGRSTALEGLGRLLTDGDAELEWFGEHHARELSRLEHTVELLSLLREDPGRKPEPLNPRDTLPTLVELWSRGGGRPLPVELRYEGAATAVRVSWPAFRRAVLVLLGEAEARAREAGGRGLRLELRAEGDEAAIRVAWEEDGDERAKGRDSTPALRRLFQALGGRLEAPQDETRLEARLPVLGAGG